MSKLPNLRDIGLVLGGVLVGACLLAFRNRHRARSGTATPSRGRSSSRRTERIEWSAGRIIPKGGEESHYIPVMTVPPTFRRDCFQTTTTVTR